ncbi:MAG: ribonuclease III [Marinilabiliales bacterium]|nr:MAG: ribonuclease III [Marinilabiliales bacterium]
MYKSIKNIFGFYPGNVFLYKLALRHKSATKKKINGLKVNNERLEFLGDALISAIVAEFLFRKYPFESEGFLTDMRSKIVSRSALNKLSLKLGLNSHIVAGNEQGKNARSAGGDAFEAFIGAMYLDKGYDFTRKVLTDRIIKLHIDLEVLESTEVNYKSKIVEWSQKNKISASFDVVDEIGQKFHKQYEVAVMIDGKEVSKARDFSIRGAEKIAAEKAWKVLSESEQEKE